MAASIRPDDWNLPLLVHVAGAMLLVASLAVVTAVMTAAVRRRADTATLAQAAFRTLLLGVIPAYVVMRAGAEWIASKEDLADEAWLGIGYAASDGGLLLALVATVLAARARRQTADRGRGGRLAVATIGGVLLVAYTVAIWAMTTKPG